MYMNKYIKIETMKITSSSGIYKAIYHYDSDVLLFGKTKQQNFEISCKLFILRHPPKNTAPQSFKIK